MLANTLNACFYHFDSEMIFHSYLFVQTKATTEMFHFFEIKLSSHIIYKINTIMNQNRGLLLKESQ